MQLAPLVWQTKELTAAHNNELREMMSAQEMEMDELREQAASSREQELRELKAAHETELHQARMQVGGGASSEAAVAVQKRYEAELEGLDEDDVPLLDIPYATPLVYQFDAALELCDEDERFGGGDDAKTSKTSKTSETSIACRVHARDRDQRSPRPRP